MPLSFCKKGEKMIVRKVGGSSQVKQHLNELGFNMGTEVTVINDINGDLIVKIKDARIAINKNMAAKIVV